MDAILHAVEIERPPADVYRAVATGEGLSGWWSTKVDAEERVGGMVRFTFMPVFNPEMEITSMDEPSLVAWRCAGGHDPWSGSTFRFEITGLDGGRSRLMFRQSYGVPIDDVAYGTYNYNWGYYMLSLKEYVETGSGRPHRPEGA